MNFNEVSMLLNTLNRLLLEETAASRSVKDDAGLKAINSTVQAVQQASVQFAIYKRKVCLIPSPRLPADDDRLAQLRIILDQLQ
jgi:hypothetical protein